MIDLNAIPSRKPQDHSPDGYLYVVRLSTGVVKVGKSRNPRARIGNHVDNAAKFGASVDDAWLSPLHENYSANERVLISSLGDPVHGAEYFRVEFSEAVAVAATLAFTILTDDQRAARDEASAELARAKAKSLFQSLDGGDFVRIKVPAEDANALQILFSEELPAGFSDSDQDDGKISDLIDLVSNTTGIAVEEIREWSYLDVIEHIAKTAIHIQSLKKQAAAFQAGRRDLTDPCFWSVSA